MSVRAVRIHACPSNHDDVGGENGHPLLAILHAESSLDVVDGVPARSDFMPAHPGRGQPETDVGHRAPEDLLARVAGGPEEGVIDFPDAPVFQACDEENGRAQPEDAWNLASE